MTSPLPARIRLHAQAAATRCAAVALLVLSPCAVADEDISRRVHNMKPFISTITLVGIDPRLLTNHSLSEKEMLKLGCSYVLTEQRDIDTVVDIVVRGDIRETPPFFRPNLYPELMGIDPRLGIYITLNDGRRHKMLFTGTFDVPKKEYGVYNDAISILPYNLHFAPELRAFIAPRTHEPSSICSPIPKPPSD